MAALPDFANDPGELIALYRAMVLTRAFDAKAVALQRTGRLGTYGMRLTSFSVAKMSKPLHSRELLKQER